MNVYRWFQRTLVEGSSAEASLPTCCSNGRGLALIGASSIEREPYSVCCGMDWKSSSLPSGLGQGTSIYQLRGKQPEVSPKWKEDNKSNNLFSLCQQQWDETLPFVEAGRAEEEKARNLLVLPYVRAQQMSVGDQIQTPNFINLRQNSRGWGSKWFSNHWNDHLFHYYYMHWMLKIIFELLIKRFSFLHIPKVIADSYSLVFCWGLLSQIAKSDWNGRRKVGNAEERRKEKDFWNE